jgi:hypothetical protein
MTTTEFRAYLFARPFRRFTIHLADGREIPVHHEEFVSLSPSGRTAHVYQPDDSSKTIDLLLVTSLKTKSNGKSHRK